MSLKICNAKKSLMRVCHHRRIMTEYLSAAQSAQAHASEESDIAINSRLFTDFFPLIGVLFSSHSFWLITTILTIYCFLFSLFAGYDFIETLKQTTTTRSINHSPRFFTPLCVRSFRKGNLINIQCISVKRKIIGV